MASDETFVSARAGPDWQVVELTVGDATLDFDPDEVRSLVARMVPS